MSLERAKAIADAVLLERDVLYPDRASSAKNKYQCTFGVLAPREWSEAGGCEPWWMQAELLVAPTGVAQLEGVLRFLHPRMRRIEALPSAEGEEFCPVESLDVDGRLLLPWEEGELQEISLRLPLAEASGEEQVIEFEVTPALETERVVDARGVARGRLVRERRGTRGVIRICTEPARASRPLLRVRIRVENVASWADREAKREEVLRSSCANTHLLLGVTGGEFVSHIDPPEWARGAVEACRNVRSFPVLAGARGRRDLMLASPILLNDHPEIAPESPGDFFDATEEPVDGIDDADRMWMRGRREDMRIEGGSRRLWPFDGAQGERGKSRR